MCVMIILVGGMIINGAIEFHNMHSGLLDTILVSLGGIVGIGCVGSGLYVLWEEYIKKT